MSPNVPYKARPMSAGANASESMNMLLPSEWNILPGAMISPGMLRVPGSYQRGDIVSLLLHFEENAAEKNLIHFR